MKVRYNIATGVVLIALGAISEFLGLWLYLLGESEPMIYFVWILIAMGVLYLVRPYFWVQPNVVEVPALVGPVRRRFPYQSLEIDGGKLIAVGEDGTRKKVPVVRWLSNSADWAAVTRVTHPS